MSGSELEINNIEEATSKRNTFSIKKMKEVRKLEQEIVFEYIEGLHTLLRKREKKLRKYKEKIKKLLKEMAKLRETQSAGLPQEQRDAAAAVAAEPISKEKEEGHVVNQEQTEISASAAFSFVDEMRQAAEQAQNLNGLVYEPTSGLYYDQKSGYYYNAEYGLYYDGNTGCYYSYNKTKNSYEFHSQVQVQPTQSTTKDTCNNDIFENYDNDEVVFDEFGVVTDKQKLQKIREEREQLKQEKEKHKQKKKSSDDQEKHQRVRKHKSKKRKRSRRASKSDSDLDSGKSEDERLRRKQRYDVEDGELSTSSCSSCSESDSNAESDLGKQNVPIFKSLGRFQDIAKKYPPSLRIIVQETNLEDLKVGNLSLITFKGGSLGREGNHDVVIPDVNVSKFHLKFTYDMKKSIYKCVDLGSRNGTILNGIRMTGSKTEGDSYDLVHGSVLQIGQTKLLCHVHEGNSTCGLCEPGLLIDSSRDAVTSTTVGSTVVLSHKEQLKKLQKKYGLENEKFIDANKQSGGNYNDRAATRRIQVGSSSDKEKTQSASMDTEIPSENKGFKMLSKLGWSKGEALGKTNLSSGLLEPISVSSNTGTKGLGCNDPTAFLTITATDKKKLEALKKTQERYMKADIFSTHDD